MTLKDKMNLSIQKHLSAILKDLDVCVKNKCETKEYWINKIKLELSNAQSLT